MKIDTADLGEINSRTENKLRTQWVSLTAKECHIVGQQMLFTRNKYFLNA